MPSSPGHIFLFVILLTALVTFVQLGVFSIAAEKLGLSSESAFTLLLISLIGSVINLPLFTIAAQCPPQSQTSSLPSAFLRYSLQEFKGKTTIAINVGGCLIPLFFSFYLLRNNPLTWTEAGIATVLMSGVCYAASRPVPGIGIGMPIFVAPLAAAAVAIFINSEQSAPLAYICGTLGVLIGADLMRLPDIRKMGAPLASIGGAGTFDGIFITGIVAVLLA